MGRPIDVAVVGCGHMGTHHARTVANHPNFRLVAAVDLIPERAAAIAGKHGGEARADVPDGVDAVIVATPTFTHGEVARPHLEQGRWCLVEKPLGMTAQLCKALYSPRLVVGHVERFNPAVRAAGELRPRYVEARRLGPPSGRSQDVDVVMDLMIHDIDLILEWARGEVVWIDAVGVAVLGPLIDTCSVRLRTSDGLTASLVASRVAKAPERTVRVFEHGRYTFLDLRNGRALRNGGPLPRGDDKDALTAQLDDFLLTIRGQKSAAVPGIAGERAVALAERIREVVHDAMPSMPN